MTTSATRKVPLRVLQEDLQNLIFFGRQAARSAFWGNNIPKRIGVYRNNVHLNWTETLESDYSYTRKQFSPEEWEKLELAFFTKHPPRHYELNGSIVPFVAYLKTQKVTPCVKELADCELADLMTFLHPAAVEPHLGVTNPTFTTRVYQHEIIEWFRKEAPPEQSPAQKPQVLVFYRDTHLEVNICQADPLMLLMLEHFQAPGADLADLEPERRRLLPTNKVPLQTVLDDLVERDLILL